MPQGHQEDGTFALSMGGEKLNHIIVIKGQPGGSQSLGIGGQVEFPSQNSCLQLHGSISPISKALQDGMNIGQEEDVVYVVNLLTPGTIEADIVARFLDGVGKQKPQLVGYNSESADLRILLQRALVCGVRAADFARRPEKPWEGVDYFAGGDWHVDLMTVIGGRGRGRPSLHEVAAASGIPGKFATEGGEVADLWMGGQLASIINYNERDALTTYLVWLRLAHFGGFFSPAEYLQEQQLVEDLLRDEGKHPGREHLTGYLEEWRRVRREAGAAGQIQLNF